MTTFVIRTYDGEDLGFILFANHEGDWPPAGENHCVFQGFPQDQAAGDDPHRRLVLDHKGREWTADIHYTDTEMTVRIALDSGWRMTIISNAEGNQWTAERDGETIDGTGEFL